MPNIRGGLVLCLLAGGILTYAAAAHASTVYFNDFQSTVGSEWSSNSIASAPNPDYNGTRLFLGEFGNNTVTLSLGNLPTHTALELSFQLYLIRSWDGNDTTVINGQPLGPDNWFVNMSGGPTLLNATFSNGNPAGQSYGGANSSYGPGGPCTPYAPSSTPGVYAPMTGAAECYSLGYTFYDAIRGTNEAMDSVYDLSFTIPHSGNTVAFNFGAAGLQSLSDESWGLDNVRVSTVPVPGAFGLFAAGMSLLFAVARLRRRS